MNFYFILLKLNIFMEGVYLNYCGKGNFFVRNLGFENVRIRLFFKNCVLKCNLLFYLIVIISFIVVGSV